MAEVVRRRDGRIKFVVLGVFIAVFLFSFLAQEFKDLDNEAEAVSLANFDPGYIISDYQMGNYNSMSEAEIQAFLMSKGNCRDTRTYLAGYYPSVSYHIKDGHFVCLAEETFGEGTAYGDEAPNGESAAHVIYRAAQDYRINPQVLIVLLQKEQGLITDSWPNNRQFRSATGYGCPDTAPCNAEYYGFKNQVRKAAAMFRTVLDGGWTNYPLGNNYVQYNPSAACGGSVVNIRSLATSALYRYTPYQPNASALAAGYGTGDSCGAYGNRNFYLYFEDWFGGVTREYSEKFGRVIPDGTYQITSSVNLNLAFDIYGGIVENMESEKIIAYESKGKNVERANQTFEVKYNNSGYYYIYNNHSDLYLSNDEGKLKVQKKDGTCKQNWNLKRNSIGIYEIISACDGRNIRISSNKEINLSSGNEKWKFFEISGQTDILKDGIYQISSATSKSYVLDIKGGINIDSVSGEMNVWVRKTYNEDWSNQIYDVKYDENTGYYSIKNHLSGLMLDVYKGESLDGTKVVAWKSNGGCNQRWMIRKVGDGFMIISACTGKVLDISGGVKVGQDVIIYTNHGGDNQRWKFDNAEYNNTDYNGEYMIVSMMDTNKVLDIKGGITNKSKSGDVIIFTRKVSNNKNQIFRLKKDSKSDYYYIYNSEANLYLDVFGGNNADGTKIIFWPYNGACNQKWKLSVDKYGLYSIASACSNKLLDIYGGNINNGSSVILFPGHGGNNQKWLLLKNSGGIE